MTVKVDSASKIVASLSIKSKGLFNFSATLTPGNDVSISAPTKSEKFQAIPKDPSLTSSDARKNMSNVSEADYLEFTQYLKDYVKNGVPKDTKVQVIDDWSPYVVTE